MTPSSLRPARAAESDPVCFALGGRQAISPGELLHEFTSPHPLHFLSDTSCPDASQGIFFLQCWSLLPGCYTASSQHLPPPLENRDTSEECVLKRQASSLPIQSGC